MALSIPSGSPLTFDSGPLQARIFQGSGHLALAGPDLAGTPHAIVITFEPPAVVVGGASRTIGRVVSSTTLADGLQLVQDLHGTNVKVRLTFPFDGVLRYEVVDWNGLTPDQTTVTAASDAGEHFFGFGERFNSIEQTGRVVKTRTFDHAGDKFDPVHKDRDDFSYKPAPWFISSRGYGFHLVSTAESTFDMRASAPDRYSATNPSPALIFQVVYGPKLTDVLSRYTGYSGRPFLPPPFAFGPWISSDIWRNGGEVRYAVTKFRDRKIPVSGFVFDSPWASAYNDFLFNMTQFGTATPSAQRTFEGVVYEGFHSPDEIMTLLRENGLKAILWMTPFINDRFHDDSERKEVPGLIEKSPNFDDGVARGVFVRERAGGPALGVDWWKGHGSPVDFTSPSARTWLTDQLRAIIEQGRTDTRTGARGETAVGGFKTDDGEAQTIRGANHNPTGQYIPETAAYADGRTGKELRNGYCVEYHKTISGVLGDKGLIFARSGFTGTQAFPGGWAGDNEPNFGDTNGLPSVIVAGLSAAMSGFSIWSHDVGGYQNNNFSKISPADLFIRWTQFGCFSPIMQMHRQVDGRNLRQYPWGYPEAGESTENNQALDNYRFYATFHTRLFPYLYSSARDSQETGLPILRPLVLIHQDDPQTFAVLHSYYFGDALLVAPVIQPEIPGKPTERGVYLPEGDWIDFWTNERHAGKQDITWKNPALPAEPKSKIPVFVRLGSIVPLILGEDVRSLCDPGYINDPTVKTWDGGLELRIYPAGTTEFTVFDGTHVQSVEAAGATTLTIDSPTPRPVLLRILGAKPAVLRRDGTALHESTSAADLNKVTEGWFFDGASGTVVVKFQAASGSTQVTF